jgi:hypothetical protein
MKRVFDAGDVIYDAGRSTVHVAVASSRWTGARGPLVGHV